MAKKGGVYKSVSSKGVFGKGVGNSKNASEMRQKCVKMGQKKWVFFYWQKRNVQNTSEIRQNCVKNASKMLLGENTIWTIPNKLHAGWFINRTPGEFINSGLFIKFKGLLRGNPTERAESLILNFWLQGSL